MLSEQALYGEHLPGSQVFEFRENADIQGNRFLCVLSSANKALPRCTSDVEDNCAGESKAGGWVVSYWSQQKPCKERGLRVKKKLLRTPVRMKALGTGATE